MSTGAEIKLSRVASPAATPSTASTPAASNSPPVIQINGKTFRVTQVQVKTNDTWEDVDMSTYSPAQLTILATRCKNIFDKMNPAANPLTTDPLKKMTFYFENNESTEPLSSRILGPIISSLKVEPRGYEVTKFEYQTEKSDKLEVYDLEEAEQAQIKDDVEPMAPLLNAAIVQVASKAQSKKTSRNRAPTPIDQSIREAGTQDNRCAARSIALKELSSGQPEDIKVKYGLPQELDLAGVSEQQRVTILSEALIKKAAAVIGNPDRTNVFLRTHIKDERQPCLQAIDTALREYQRSRPTFSIPATPAEKVAKYAELMVGRGFMQDLPLFLALKQPFIIMQEINNSYQVIAVSDTFTILGPIDNYDLNKVNILSFNDTNKHYQPFIPANDQAKTAIRELLKNYVNGLIDNLINDLRDPRLLSDERETRNTDNFKKATRIYPAAKREIIQKLQQAYPDKALALAALEKPEAGSDEEEFIDYFTSNLHECIHPSSYPADSAEEID